MNGERHARRQRGAAGVHAHRTIGAHREFAVRVAPEVKVVGEQIHADAEPRHARELRRIGHLAMLQRVAMVGSRVGL